MARLARNRSDIIGVRGTKGIVANLYSRVTGVRAATQRETRRWGHHTRQIAFNLARKDTWFMANHIKLEFTEQQLQFSVYLDPDDFHGAGEAYYPYYEEMGASNHPASPFMRPAWERTAPRYEAAIRRVVRRAIRTGRAGL